MARNIMISLSMVFAIAAFAEYYEVFSSDTFTLVGKCDSLRSAVEYPGAASCNDPVHFHPDSGGSGLYQWAGPWAKNGGSFDMNGAVL